MPIKKAVLLLSLASKFLFGTYAYQATFTINHAKVPNTDQTNFPVLISGTYLQMATIANGGYVTNANGYDIIFTADAACSSKLSWETEYYSPNGQVIFWVDVPLLSHTADTVFYACIGNSYIIADQSNKAGAWNSGYAAVYHLDETAFPYLDSTVNGKNSRYASPNGYLPSSTAGFLGGGLSFNMNAQQGVGFDEILSGSGPATVTAWVKAVNGQPAVVWDGRGGNGVGMCLFVNASDGKPNLTFNPPNSGISGSTSITDGKWHYIAGAYDGSKAYLYVDGSLVASGAVAGVSFGGNWSYIGVTYSFVYGASTQDETRLSTMSRSADWLATEFSNESSPATFYSVAFAAIPPLPFKVKSGVILW
jgi:hypothetical protein